MREIEREEATRRAEALQGGGTPERELWRVVPFATQYQASSSGQVRRIKNGYVLRPSLVKSGQYRVSLYLKGRKKPIGYSLHRVIAITFIDNPYNCPCVRQKDGNRQINSSANLEWCTYSDTMQHAYDAGLKKPTRGPAIRTPLGIFSHQREAAKAAGITQTALRWRLNSEHFPEWHNLQPVAQL